MIKFLLKDYYGNDLIYKNNNLLNVKIINN